MSSLQIKNAKKSYGSLEVIHGVDLDVTDGEFVILVGPSGCGKSTLLRMIAGLEDITSGEIILENKIINKLPPRERDIAMVFQSYALYPHKTVEKNMAFSLQLAGNSKQEIAEKVKVAAEVLDLTPLLQRKPSQLSGGQRQRVAMGRAIVRNPKLFLFDEPLSNLDAKLRVQMRTEIKELHQRIKTTIVYVTHDQVEAMTMADRIVVMNGGNIEQVGPPMELYDNPQSIFVASFLGSPGMNLLNGHVEDNKFILPSDDNIELQKSYSPGNKRAAVLGIRPENIIVSETDSDFGIATIRVVEPTGSETHLTLDYHGEKMIVVVRDRRVFEKGQTVTLSADKQDFRLFDKETGERI